MENKLGRHPHNSSIDIAEPTVGRDVHLNVIFIRHGEKDASMHLTQKGIQQSQELGRHLASSGITTIKEYASASPRAIQTSFFVLNPTASEIPDPTTFVVREPRIRGELSARSIELDPDKSSFFIEFTRRFKQAFNSSEDRERLVEKFERDRIGEWIGFDAKRPDEGTASPREVARGVAKLLDHYIRMAKRVKSKSDFSLLNTTHEFQIAATIRYLLQEERGDGTIKDGLTILKEIGHINHLEGIYFNIKTDSDGKETVSATLRDRDYKLDVDQLQKLLND